MIDTKPATYISAMLDSKKRLCSSVAHSAPLDDLVRDYDNDVARAIRANDVDMLRMLLDDGRCFDGANRNGETMMHLACRRADVDVVEFLVYEAHLPTDRLDGMGRTILHDVLWRPRYQEAMEILDLLLRVVSPDLLLAEDMRGHSCFDYCRKADYGHWNAYMCKYRDLLQRRAKLAGLQSIELPANIM